MTSGRGTTEAERMYAKAHTAHHRKKDLREALKRYQSIQVTHPDSPEAGYSFTQIQNIVVDVVPKQDLFDAQVQMALSYFEQTASEDDGASALRQERDEADDAWDMAEREQRRKKVRLRAAERRRGFQAG